MAAGEDLLSDFDGKEECVSPELFAGVAFVHLRIDVERGEELVEGRCRRMHHEGIVHALVRDVTVLSTDVRVFLVDHRCHGEASLLLVDGLRDEDAGIVRTKVEEEGTCIIHHGDECFVADPRGVEENVVAQVTDAFDDLSCIADAAVIGAEFDDGEADGTLCFRAFGVFLGDEGTDVVLIQTMGGDAADGAIGISFRFQIDGDGTGQDKRAKVDGFMIVPVVEDEVAGGKDGIQDDLVRCRCAIQDEVGLVCVEDLRGMLLRSKRRSFMDEQIA